MLFLHICEYCDIEKASNHNLIQVQGLCLCLYVIGDNGDLLHRQQLWQFAEIWAIQMHLRTTIQDYGIRSKPEHNLMVIFYSLALYLGWGPQWVEQDM